MKHTPPAVTKIPAERVKSDPRSVHISENDSPARNKSNTNILLSPATTNIVANIPTPPQIDPETSRKEKRKREERRDLDAMTPSEFLKSKDPVRTVLLKESIINNMVFFLIWHSFS
ncbi:hypothetical protein J6590_040186 [Homalodisca vitripennis]|nr:hypothetical protein J6590_040186 [Homalodisca vitripennis]